MSKDGKKFYTVQQIDGSSIKTPHQRELDTIGDSVLNFLPGIPKEKVKEAVLDEMGGRIDDLGFGEDFTLTFTYFPEVIAHVIYYGPDDSEEDLMAEPEVKFLFSGEKVTWVSSEDLASLIDLTMDYLRDLLLEPGKENELPAVQSDLLQKSIVRRLEPFKLLDPIEVSDLSLFIDGKVTSIEGEWKLSKEFFPGIIVSIDFDGSSLGVDFEGNNIKKINNYAKDQLAIFLMNHCLRFISIEHESLEMPDIVKKAFSFSYLREKEE
ncbi:MAG: hypothetical protein ACFFCS_26000 [Candidatus Hodarchaeota archaeon]